MNPKPGKKHNLPQETQGKNGNFQRIDQYTPNTFYADWLNQFVEILYTFDQAKRPTASEALQLLNQSMINPNMTVNPIKKKTYIDNNMNPFFKPNSLAQNNNQAILNLTQFFPHFLLFYHNYLHSNFVILLFFSLLSDFFLLRLDLNFLALNY